MLALVYNPKDRKLTEDCYSYCYLHQFRALCEKWPDAVHITESQNVSDLAVDVIIFYDIHSSHQIELEGIRDHSAIKYEYFNDPHQRQIEGFYHDGRKKDGSFILGEKCIKLNAENRTKRALERGINFIICPFTEPYYNYIAPHLDGQADSMRVWFPTAPSVEHFTDRFVPLTKRKKAILANGSENESKEFVERKGYVTRSWAHRQHYVDFVPHCLDAWTGTKCAPKGKDYPNFLSKYASAIAITDDHIVPKYLEIPLAGCLCFASEHDDYKNMGFEDGKNCVFVTKKNFKERVMDFLNHVEDYQEIATAGRKQIEDNWTAKHFADFLYKHAEEQLSK